jgi:hypothetical protein
MPQTTLTSLPLAVARNRDALIRIAATLFAMLGLAETAGIERIPRERHSAVMRILRPAESAVRRLIVFLAQGIEVKPSRKRSSSSKPAGKDKTRKKGAPKRSFFQLFDPRKIFAQPRVKKKKNKGPGPRITVLGHDPTIAAMQAYWAPPPPPAPAPVSDGLINAGPLIRRLHALKDALADLPAQAIRLARAEARRLQEPGRPYKSPIRPGRPPGHRKKPIHEVDHILADCHWLARDAVHHDTS